MQNIYVLCDIFSCDISDQPEEKQHTHMPITYNLQTTPELHQAVFHSDSELPPAIHR